MVCSAVVEKGPITLEALTKSLPFPQSATYRALQQLIAQGWVQRSIGRSGFVAAYALRAMLSTGRFGFPYERTARAVVKGTRERDLVHFDFALLEPEGAVRVMDSTDPPAARLEPLVLTTSVLGRAAVCALAPEVRVPFLRRYLAQASEAERTLSAGPQFAGLFRFHAERRFIWDRQGNALAFAFQSAEGAFGAVRLRAKRSSATRSQVLIQATLSCLRAHQALEAPEFSILLGPDELTKARLTLTAEIE